MTGKSMTSKSTTGKRMTGKSTTGKTITGGPDETAPGGKPAKPDGRQARLEQALRANLLKRKEKARASKGRRMPEEGRQT